MNRQGNLPSTGRKSRAKHKSLLAKDPFLNRPHSVVESKGQGVDVTIFCDASAKGYLAAKDSRSFAGYGYLISGRSHTRESEWSRFGGMPNASPFEAELFSILKALGEIRFPANVKIITDCSNAVKQLANRGAALKRLQQIENTRPKDRSSADWARLAPLKIIQRIDDYLSHSDKILSLDIQWVRAHTLDNLDRIPDPEKIKDSTEKESLEWRIGNFHADHLASEGVRKAVRNAIWKFRHLEESAGNRDRNYERDLDRHTAMCRKNFMYSSFVRDEAINFLSEKKDFLPSDIVENILPKRDSEQVLASWNSISYDGSNPFLQTKSKSPLDSSIRNNFEMTP